MILFKNDKELVKYAINAAISWENSIIVSYEGGNINGLNTFENEINHSKKIIKDLVEYRDKIKDW